MPRRTARLVVLLAVVVAVGVIMLSPVNTVVGENTGTVSVTNESVTANFNDTFDLRGYDIDGTSEVVWGLNETSGNFEQATEGTDYTLYTENGSISFNSSSTLIDSGEEVKVSYDYQATGTTTTLVVGFIPVMIAVLLLVAVAKNVEGMF